MRRATLLVSAILSLFAWSAGAVTYYPMMELERGSGYRLLVRSDATTSDYLVGKAFGFQRFSLTQGSTFAATIYSCETPTYVAQACESQGTLSSSTSSLEVLTGRAYIIIDITTAETGSAVSYINYRGSTKTAKAMRSEPTQFTPPSASSSLWDMLIWDSSLWG